MFVLAGLSTAIYKQFLSLLKLMKMNDSGLNILPDYFWLFLLVSPNV